MCQAAEPGRRGTIDHAFSLGCVVVFVMHRSRESVPMPMRETAVRGEYLPLPTHTLSHTPAAELPFLALPVLLLARRCRVSRVFVKDVALDEC